MKQCFICKTEKPLVDFVKQSASADGHSCYCKQCATSRAYQWYKDHRLQHNERKRERYHQNHNTFLRDKVCAHCGGVKRLHIHHVDPTTKNKYAETIWTWTQAKRDIELAKCIVLCHACHIRHHKAKPQVHGTMNSYSKRRCRCGLCRGVNAISDKLRDIRPEMRKFPIIDYIFNLSQHFAVFAKM